MGAANSHHQPLERVSAFRRAASLRLSRSKRRSPQRMDKLRRSLRESFRKKRDQLSSVVNSPSTPSGSQQQTWNNDEALVRSGNCRFLVKYLGCVQVFESRGMQTCDEAIRVLRQSKRKPVKAILHISGDGLRVIDSENEGGLIVDQTIEKVSFCAPDRFHEAGFSYICRDGTTRRWMCHGFLAVRESGERLSHAVGCAFALCLEKKEKRDKEAVSVNYDCSNSAFTRLGSYRRQSVRSSTSAMVHSSSQNFTHENTTLPPTARERPHATASLFERQGSVRLGQASPFKRQLSLRVNQLPSTIERSNAMRSNTIGDNNTMNALCHQLSSGMSLSLTSFRNEQEEAKKQKLMAALSSIEDNEGEECGLALDRLLAEASANALTPPANALTPPPSPTLSAAQLPAPDQWLGTVASKAKRTNPFLDCSISAESSNNSRSHPQSSPSGGSVILSANQSSQNFGISFI